MTQEFARALTDAGYMPASEYIELSLRMGWVTHPTDADIS